MKKLKTFVYVDGFNLYYRVKQIPHCKWLNIQKLISNILNVRQHDILSIKYFTALVNPPGGPEQFRQKLFLRALKTISNLKIIYGKYKRREVKGFLCEKINGKIKPTKEKVIVSKYEEKESDVNIASHLLRDSYENKYDCVVLISNDTDLKTPLRFVKSMSKKIIIITPQGNTHVDLKKLSHYQRKISDNDLKNSLFPYKITDKKGEFFCPKKWKK